MSAQQESVKSTLHLGYIESTQRYAPPISGHNQKLTGSSPNLQPMQAEAAHQHLNFPHEENQKIYGSTTHKNIIYANRHYNATVSVVIPTSKA